MTAIATIQSTSAKLGDLGADFYFVPATLAKGKELGLDGFRFYVLGRGGVLGNVEPAVVQSAFGYFHADSVVKIWESASAKADPRTAGAVYHAACAEHGRSILAGVEGLEAFNAAAEAVVAAADPAALALFAGIAAEPLVEDAAGRAMQLCAVLREFRGSAHLVALLAAGLNPAVAHAMKRPDMVASFGWDPAPEISEDDAAKVPVAEALTDNLCVPAYSVLDEAGEAAFIAGIEAMTAALVASKQE